MTSIEYDKILDDLEKIKSRIQEIKLENNIISEERTEIAREKEFSKTTIQSIADSTVETRTVEICDFCHKKLETNSEDFGVCSKCKKKLCERCSIVFHSQVICPDDLRRIYPLSRDQFKIVWVLSNDIQNDRDIEKITGIRRRDVKEIKNFLTGINYMEKHGFFGCGLTTAGTDAFFAYSQYYGKETEMTNMTRDMVDFFG